MLIKANHTAGCSSPSTIRSCPPAGRLQDHINTWKVITRDLVGVKHDKRLSDRLPVKTSSKDKASYSTVLCRAEPINSGGGQRTSRQRSHSRSSKPSDRVLLKPVSGTKKGWGSETCNKSESTEQLCSDTCTSRWKESIH